LLNKKGKKRKKLLQSGNLEARKYLERIRDRKTSGDFGVEGGQKYIIKTFRKETFKRVACV
jgi:hypothetical protein